MRTFIWNHRAVPFICTAIVCLLCAGCASTARYGNTSTLKLDKDVKLDLQKYSSVSVMAFALDPQPESVDPKFGKNFAGQIAARLRTDFPGLFETVTWNQASGTSKELVVTGRISKYTVGSAESRLLLIGTGTSHFDGELILRNGQDGVVVFTAPFSRLWAWGGFVGGSKTVDNMVNETAVAVTKTLVVGKNGKQASN
jgi:hypothetical protein